ncbi:MAG: alpha/beta fold hydrolase [Gemmatimonadaceae bacterium]
MTALPPIPEPRASGFTTATPVPLFWVAYGPAGGQRAIVLHGGPGADHAYLLPQMLELGHQRELLFYDQRGGGRSRTDAREPITWQTHVADLGAVLRELGAGAPTIVGYSWGGLLALLYAARAAHDPALPAPERLALIDPAPVSRQFREVFESEFARRQAAPAVRALRDELAASGLRERDPAQYRHRAFELSVAGYFANPRAARNLTPFRVVGRVQQSVWESLGDYDLVRDGTLSAIHCPSVIVHGRQDPIPLASSEACARAIGAKLITLEACGHVPYVEQPAALFAALEPFLA